jgi:uncharacterized RDD family membrane protein YckC
MTCSNCGSQNSDTEHRCRRCGRRPGDTLNDEFTLHRTTGALATKPRPVAVIERPPLARPSIAPNLAGAVQANLFTPNVISMPIPAGQPRTQTAARTSTRAKASASGTNPGVKAATRKGSKGVTEGQGQLEFLAPEQSKPRTLGTTVEAMIYCEAPVATPLHRAVAAAIDWTMVLIGYGLFLMTYLLCGGGFELDRTSMMILAGALAVVASAYSLSWVILGTDSVGMRWTQLRVITFDGFPPETGQRVLRFAGSCLSLFSLLGALWSLADEEGLGWQDHISRTFPTAYDHDSALLIRR